MRSLLKINLKKLYLVIVGKNFGLYCMRMWIVLLRDSSFKGTSCTIWKLGGRDVLSAYF